MSAILYYLSTSIRLIPIHAIGCRIFILNCVILTLYSQFKLRLPATYLIITTSRVPRNPFSIDLESTDVLLCAMRLLDISTQSKEWLEARIWGGKTKGPPALELADLLPYCFSEVTRSSWLLTPFGPALHQCFSQQ